MAAAVDVPVMALRLVADPAGELAAANVTVKRDGDGPSKAEREFGDCVAHCTHRPAGALAAAAPDVQSRMRLAKFSVVPTNQVQH